MEIGTVSRSDSRPIGPPHRHLIIGQAAQSETGNGRFVHVDTKTGCVVYQQVTILDGRRSGKDLPDLIVAQQGLTSWIPKFGMATSRWVMAAKPLGETSGGPCCLSFRNVRRANLFAIPGAVLLVLGVAGT